MVVVVDYTELQGSLIATCDSGVVSSHLDPNASSFHLKGKIEGWKQMSPLGVPGVGREKAAKGKPLSSAASVTAGNKIAVRR